VLVSCARVYRLGRNIHAVLCYFVPAYIYMSVCGCVCVYTCMQHRRLLTLIQNSPGVKLMLIGNKVDNEKKRQVTTLQGQQVHIYPSKLCIGNEY